MENSSARREVTNVGNSDLPVHFAFHPYFHPDGPREEWKLTIGAQKHWIVTHQLIPTGETEPTDKFLPGVTKGVALDKTFIDDGFSDFARDSKGLGHVVIQGRVRRSKFCTTRGLITRLSTPHSIRL